MSAITPAPPMDSSNASTPAPPASASSAPPPVVSPIEHLKALGNTPILSGAMSAALFLYGSSKMPQKPFVKPNRMMAYGYSGVFALGSWIMYDGDIENGAGFNSAWSFLYLISYGGNAIKHPRISTLLLASYSLVNGLTYGSRFFTPHVMGGDSV